MAKETKKPAKWSSSSYRRECNGADQEQNPLKESNRQGSLEVEIGRRQGRVARRQRLSTWSVLLYQNSKALSELRARRREEKNTKEFLTETKNVLDKVLGGKITPTDYRKEGQELRENFRKKNRESDTQLSEEMQELRESFSAAGSIHGICNPKSAQLVLS